MHYSSGSVKCMLTCLVSWRILTPETPEKLVRKNSFGAWGWVGSPPLFWVFFWSWGWCEVGWGCLSYKGCFGLLEFTS